MIIREIQVWRENFCETRLAEHEAPALQDGQALLRIGEFALTANNVTYAAAGDMIGYWKFFPAEDGWGKPPVWGFAEVAESRCAGLEAGERLYGYFPMASHLVIEPGKLREASLIDASAHRAELPPVYNQYARLAAEPPALRDWGAGRAIYAPLFITSFLIKDWLEDNGFFGARQVLISSASSKTGFGLAAMLADARADGLSVVGLTSPGNAAFVEALGFYDRVAAYGDTAGLDGSVPSAFVDMAGSASVRAAVHETFADHLKVSSAVGLTHWQDFQGGGALPGPKPEFFFAPAQIEKRNADWGPGEAARRGLEASLKAARAVEPHVRIDRREGPEAVMAAWRDLAENRARPDQAIIGAV